MKKIAKLILIGFLVLNYACKTNSSTKELNSHFTKKEIADLKYVNNFFKEQICKNQKDKDFKTCFENMNKEFIEFGFDPIFQRVDFESQKKMYESISKSTFDKIWGFSKSWKYSDTTKYKSIGISTVGKYVDYLKDVGKENNYIIEYTDNFLSIGDIDGLGLLGYHIFEKPNDLDLNDLNIKTIISINYLTKFDNALRVEKWYDK
ncbi:MAG: hypothetical protein COB01_11930 [Lutibacter sp.]|nr:MAG: hypothetical protein COB01_11930 [Lutibacter sp.]